jgi:hypothetical protein
MNERRGRMGKQFLWVSVTASLVCFFLALQVHAASLKMTDFNGPI